MAGTDATGTRNRAGFAWNYDLLSGLALTFIGATAFLVGPGWGERAWVFPNLISWLCIGMGIVLAIIGLRRRTRERLFDSWRSAVDAAWFSASVLLFFYLVGRIGYFWATWLFISIQAFILSSGRWKLRSALAIVVLAGLLSFGLFQLFTGAFNVRLPTGAWWDA